MENKKYEVDWHVRDMDFNYFVGTENVLVSDENNAIESATQIVSRKLGLQRHLMIIKTVKVV
ncbi:hypothetical protein [Peribacillus loiseleuriae]|uniref:Uncharacterized protein n=1 Tax=Peribacillus loiseleuriae TaxID=1679170 RepID=A0A0K9GSM1_9BACI|nr:hypothetical protein [Peribacillus loiseleuriae]KMY49611.1 hypothetical protein AC625_08705 [Peribacillus loiseleuriae]